MKVSTPPTIDPASQPASLTHLDLSPWRDRRILLGLTGGIAAYKICEIASALGQSGAAVRAILTDHAQQFVSPLTLSTLCRAPVATDTDLWDPAQTGPTYRPLHIELGEWAEVILLAPLSAHSLGKLAGGLADNLLMNTLLASTCPVIVAPAMNTDMWQQVSVQRNWHQLLQDPRFHSAAPDSGLLACDRRGTGRMAEPVRLLAQLQSLLHSGGQRDLVGKRILISAGSTQEYLDPVRFIGNPSSGRMGVALALAACHRGAQVTLVHGPMAESDLVALGPDVQRYSITTADEMGQQLHQCLPQQDWLLMAAAVADVKPARRETHKLAKAELPPALPLLPVPDLVASLSQQRHPHQKIIGFAAQTGEILAPALAKLQRKGLDAIVANPVDVVGAGFGGDRNQGVLITAQGATHPIPPCSKLEMAHRIYSGLLQHL